MSRPFAKLLAYIWTVLVIVGSALPGGSSPRVSLLEIKHLDKLIHFVMYAGVVLLWSLAVRHIEDRRPWLIFFGSICLGVLMEILQNVVFVKRSFEFLDIIANIMGSIIGLVLFYKIFKKPKTC